MVAQPPTPGALLAGTSPEQVAMVRQRLMNMSQEEIDASPTNNPRWGMDEEDPAHTSFGNMFGAAARGFGGAAIASGITALLTGKGGGLGNMVEAGLIGAFGSAAKNVTSKGKEGGWGTGLEIGSVYRLAGGDDPGWKSVVASLATPYILPALGRFMYKFMGANGFAPGADPVVPSPRPGMP